MDELEDELVDVASTGNKEVPQVVKTLSILSIVGNSLWLLMFLIGTLWLLSLANSFGGTFGGMMGDFMGMFVAIILGISVLHVLGLIAAVKMMNGKKGAFIMYAIVTGLWCLLLLMSLVQGTQQGGNVGLVVISLLSSGGFIVALGTQMKNMPS
jgi:hypothetical protein